MEERIHSFAPVCGPEARVLVLGSMPSVASLNEGFYYAHPQNAFWRMAADCLNAPPPKDIAGKKALLLARGIALWDVAASCRREGSLDAAMREVLPNDVAGLLAAHPAINLVLLNGGKAAALYQKHFGRLEIEALRLPSTSPAYTLPYEKKRAAWREAFAKCGIL